MIDINKKYQYCNGGPARILCVDAPGTYTVVSLSERGTLHKHLDSGMEYVDGSNSNYDLIEVKEKKTLEFWVNIYPGGDATKWPTRLDADGVASVDRIACKHVVIEFTEGEGL